MRCVVTGGAGFLGSHLCEHLLDSGHEVTALDNLVTGREENLANLAGRRGFEFRRADVSAGLPADLGPFDALYHLASPASPVGYMRHSIETILANSTGTHRLLEACRFAGARFLFASTSEVYGNPAVHPQPETYFGNVNPYGPRSCYDESKRLGEALVYEYVHKFGVDARIVRIFNTYGPRLNPEDGRVVSNFIVQALRGEPLTVYGDGTQTRSYCYVEDLVRGIRLALETEGTKGGVYNLGNPGEYTVRELAEIVIELCGVPGGRLEYRDLPQDDPERRCPDITRAKQALGWSPRIPLREGLERTIAWYRGIMKTESTASRGS